MKTSKIPLRSEVDPKHQWDLSSLYVNDEAWNKDLADFSQAYKTIEAHKETFLNPTNSKTTVLANLLKDYAQALEKAERLGNYAFLKKSADESDSINIDRLGRYMMAATRFEAETSWLVPSLQALPESLLTSSDPELADFSVWLKKLIHLKPFILSEKEERILALKTEGDQACKTAFSVLTNVDIDFGTIRTPEGEKPLSQTSWSSFMESPNRDIRKAAYKKFYAGFDAHKNTLASLYAGSVNQDTALARIRGYENARVMALFPDKVSEVVYDNLIGTIEKNLKPLHDYYALRKKILKVDELRHYDVYVPLAAGVQKITPYEQAVSLIGNAVSPLGEEYAQTLTKGLLGSWVDRYENKGKRSGAFSSGGFTGEPYILMNYKDEVLRDVFTLAHEGGHSMHSFYSAKNNPFMSYNYTIFEAEVASTLNEDLLFRYLTKHADSAELKTYLLANRASDIVATLYRQTMFAQFEHLTHQLVEAQTPLTLDLLRAEYKNLLTKYFGPEMLFEEESDLEALRIPHFYNAFYVYKYATGISASLALAERISSGGKKERDDYFAFLKSGGSRYPIEALRLAGVDMESSEPVQAACDEFARIVDELSKLLQ